MVDWPVAPHGTYFGPDGRELTTDEWVEMLGARSEDLSSDSWWRRCTEISSEVTVSTAWLGLNHAFLPGRPPLFWETMIFGGEHDEALWRYGSREEALDDHERIVRALRKGRDPYA